MKERPRTYVVTKYVTAINATEAIRLSKEVSVHEVELLEDWDAKDDE